MRSGPIAIGSVALCLAGCFVDAIGGGSGEGGSAEVTTGASSTSTTDPQGPTTTGSTVSTGPSVGGGGSGDGGQGGAPCTERGLRFDESDFARVDSADVNIGNDFTVGAWVYPEQPAAFVPGDSIQAFEWIIDHARFSNEEGYLIGIGEPNDDGQAVAAFVAFPSGTLCAAAFPIAWNQWVHLAGHYQDDIAGDDLFLYVNGNQVASDNCDWFPPVDFDGPLVLGGRAETSNQFFLGVLDDVFVKHGGMPADVNAPLGCDSGFVAAFDFDASLASSCASPTLTLGLDASPADPQIVCAE